MTQIVTQGGETRQREATTPRGEAVRLLVVDDEEGVRATVTRVLRRSGVLVETAESAAVALTMLDRASFDVVLVDVRMPAMGGPEFLCRVKQSAHSVEVVMMTAFDDIATTVQAVKAGAFGFLTKPFASNDALVQEVLKAAEFRRLRERNVALERELSAHRPDGAIVWSCASMRDVERRVAGVAAANSTVLILGESGTGKELVARAIHERSSRSHKALVTLNCAAIPRELVESELFGHARGAFTTAITARQGIFESANGGTLFLDEIGELPISAQVKLLRTLQSGEIRPVGADSTKIVDVRVVAATNVDLEAAIAAGTFRRDLFYRLNVIDVRLPPLRERGDDVLLLAHHFIRKHARLNERSGLRLGNEAARLLEHYSWPGNVRELEHAIEHAVVLSRGDTIVPGVLPDALRRTSRSAFIGPDVAQRPFVEVDEPADEAAVPSTLQLDLVSSVDRTVTEYPEAKARLLAQFNLAYVRAILHLTSGNLSEAARLSGLDRSNFRRLVRATTAA